MKTKSILLALALSAAACQLLAQVGGSPGDGQRSPPRGSGPDRTRNEPEPAETLTDAQKAQVKAILSKFDPKALTAETAKAIHEAFRQAGLRGGPVMADTIKSVGFDPDKLRDLAPPAGRGEGETNDRQGVPPGGGERKARQGGSDSREPEGGQPGGQGGYSIEQAISDRAQLNTIAFDGLAFVTGDFGGNTFLPPGKVADFCGFQYMRDVDQNELGHNTSFVPRAANNVLHILTEAQKAQLVALAKEQEQMLTEFAQKRFPLVKAFCRQLQGDLPAGRAGLDREAVMKYTAQVFEIDGLLSYRRAEVLGGIVRSLTPEQKAYLAKMVFNNSATWPELADQIDKKSMSHTAHVAVMTYASEMFSWYAGSLEADVYFCPERHATYFGSFYMKDIPAMGNPNYSISTSLTGDSGEAFLAALSESQRQLVTSLVDQQRADLEEIVKTRRAIAAELRRFMKEASVDKGKVMALSKRYGELDGEISYYYATAFAQVAKTLSAEQKATLLRLRNLDAKFNCTGAYLYSRAIPMPEVPNTDFLFTATDTLKSASTTGGAAPAAAKSGLVLRSPAVADGGQLPVEFTGDGASATLPLEWSGAPEGTKSLAVVMHHIDPEGKAKWYWVLYNLPADTRSLAKNVSSLGTLGNNSVNGRTGYAPPHSKGPGAKTYVYTVYALSAPVKLDVPPAQVSREVLLAAMKDKLLASAEMKVVYTRPASALSQGGDPPASALAASPH
jgi:Raf kinase inhibitor-like YbhB/YbcL family protein